MKHLLTIASDGWDSRMRRIPEDRDETFTGEHCDASFTSRRAIDVPGCRGSPCHRAGRHRLQVPVHVHHLPEPPARRLRTEDLTIAQPAGNCVRCA